MATVQDVIDAAERLKSARNNLEAVKVDIQKTDEALTRLKALRTSLSAEVDAAKTALRQAAAELV